MCKLNSRIVLERFRGAKDRSNPREYQKLGLTEVLFLPANSKPDQLDRNLIDARESSAHGAWALPKSRGHLVQRRGLREEEAELREDVLELHVRAPLRELVQRCVADLRPVHLRAARIPPRSVPKRGWEKEAAPLCKIK